MDFELSPLSCNEEVIRKNHSFNQLLFNSVLQCRNAVFEEELGDLLKEEIL